MYGHNDSMGRIKEGIEEKERRKTKGKKRARREWNSNWELKLWQLFVHVNVVELESPVIKSNANISIAERRFCRYNWKA